MKSYTLTNYTAWFIVSDLDNAPERGDYFKINGTTVTCLQREITSLGIRVHFRHPTGKVILDMSKLKDFFKSLGTTLGVGAIMYFLFKRGKAEGRAEGEYLVEAEKEIQESEREDNEEIEERIKEAEKERDGESPEELEERYKKMREKHK